MLIGLAIGTFIGFFVALIFIATVILMKLKPLLPLLKQMSNIGKMTSIIPDTGSKPEVTIKEEN